MGKPGDIWNGLRIDPFSAKLRVALSIAELVKGRDAQAAGELSAALKLDPNISRDAGLLQIIEEYPTNAILQVAAGRILFERGKLDEAITSFREAVRLRPEVAEAHAQLALALNARGAIEESIVEYRDALARDPDSVGALNNLAWILATSGRSEFRNGSEAVRLAERACELTHYHEVVFIGTLAAALAEAGQFKRAVSTSTRACDLATMTGETGLLKRTKDFERVSRAANPGASKWAGSRGLCRSW